MSTIPGGDVYYENDTDDSGIENDDYYLKLEEPVNENVEAMQWKKILVVQSRIAWLILLSLRVAVGTSHPRC